MDYDPKRPFHLHDEQDRAIPGERTYEELGLARRRAELLDRRVIVVKRLPNGDDVHMAYSGPGGWTGPKARPPLHPSYFIPIKGKHPTGETT